MPIYEYECSKCGHQFELIRPSTAGKEEIHCPSCGGDRVQKRFSAFACTGSKESSAPLSSGCSSRSGRFT